MAQPFSSDHDLLIAISTKLDFLTETIKTFPTQLAKKADLDDFNELKTSVSSLQRFKWTLVGGLLVLQTLVEFWLHK